MVLLNKLSSGALNNVVLPEYEKYCVLEYAMQNENLLVVNRDENLKNEFREIVINHFKFSISILILLLSHLLNKIK